MIHSESNSTTEPQSAVTAGPPDAEPMAERMSRTRTYADLPHSCRCGARWAGNRTCHCGGCHLTFSGVGHFDRHRSHGQCLTPAEIGLSLLSTRAYACWGETGQGEDAET